MKAGTENKMAWIINKPKYDEAQAEQWQAPDLEDFETEEDFYNVHVLWAEEEPESVDDVSLPVARNEDGVIVLVYEALNSAHDMASRVDGLTESQVDEVRELLEGLREKEFPDMDPLDADEEDEEDGKSFSFNDKVPEELDGYDRKY